MWIWVNNITTLRWWWCCARALLPTVVIKLIMLGFNCLLYVGNEMFQGTCKREDENTCVSNYHLPVSIQHRLNNESRKPSNYQTVKSICRRIGVTSAMEVVCCCCGWCRRFEIPTTQRFHRHSFHLKVTHRCSYRPYELTVNIYIYGNVLLSAPRSQIAVSSICYLIPFSLQW